MAIYRLAYRLDRVVAALSEPVDATHPHPDAVAALDGILSSADCPDTFQRKETNIIQIESLVGCVCTLVHDVEVTINGDGNYNSSKSHISPLVLDIGAGKALFTRAVYETLRRKVPCVAFDRRHQFEGDLFYDPKEGEVDDQHEQPYTRLVGDVGRLSSSRTLDPLRSAKGGGVVAITKHLCGGATDNSLIALCRLPLSDYVGGACLAPCCHQKTRREQYCNVPYLQRHGFCQTHRGLRGNMQDNDFRTFGMLINMSRAKDGLQDFEYKKSVLLSLLGFDRAADLGRKARRVLEEGRAVYLRERGYDVHVVRYCDRSVTGDNLALIAKRRIARQGVGGAVRPPVPRKKKDREL